MGNLQDILGYVDALERGRGKREGGGGKGGVLSFFTSARRIFKPKGGNLVKYVK